MIYSSIGSWLILLLWLKLLWLRLLLLWLLLTVDIVSICYPRISLCRLLPTKLLLVVIVLRRMRVNSSKLLLLVWHLLLNELLCWLMKLLVYIISIYLWIDVIGICSVHKVIYCKVNYISINIVYFSVGYILLVHTFRESIKLFRQYKAWSNIVFVILVGFLLKGRTRS